MLQKLSRIGVCTPQLADLRWKLELIEQVYIYQGLDIFIHYIFTSYYLSMYCNAYILFTNLVQDSVLGARGELLYTIEMDVVSTQTRYYIMLSSDTSSQRL